MTKTMRHRLTSWWHRRNLGWVPEVALRYLPVVEWILSEPPRGLVVEVRVNRSELTSYLRRPVVGGD